jgi:hypothetical protein
VWRKSWVEGLAQVQRLRRVVAHLEAGQGPNLGIRTHHSVNSVSPGRTAAAHTVRQDSVLAGRTACALRELLSHGNGTKHSQAQCTACR